VQRSLAARLAGRRSHSSSSRDITSNNRDTRLRAAVFMTMETLELRRMLAYTPTTVTDSPPEAFANFGAGAATNGDRALVPAAQHSSEAFLVTGEVQLIDTTDGHEVRTLENPVPSDFAFFGSGVTWVGNKMVVGASGVDRVYVYDDENDTTPEEIQNPNGGEFSGFGISMAQIDGDLLVGNGTFSGGPGEVLRFDLDTPGNPLVATYSYNNATNDPDLIALGTAIAVHNGKIYAVARDHTSDSISGDAGVVVEFDAVADADTGTFQRLITEPGPVTQGSVPFGFSLGIAGNNLLVGSQDAHKVYQLDLTSLASVTYAVPPGEENGLGYSIAVNGAQVALGSLNSTGGAVYIYNWADQSHVDTLSNPAEPVGSNATNDLDNFGINVASLPDGGFLVSDPADDHDNGSEVLQDSGAVYIFTPDTAPNQAPTADAGPDQTVNENQSITLDGSASTDPDGNDDIVSYAWDLDNNGSYETSGPIIPFTSDSPATYTIGLQVTDSANHTANDTIVVTFDDVTPTADAGPDQSAGTNQTVNFSGSGANTAGDAITAFAWDLDNDGAFDDAFTANTSTSFSTGGAKTVRLRVTDDDGQTAIDSLVVTVTDPAPTANAGADQFGRHQSDGHPDGSATAGAGDTIASYAWDFNYNGVTFDVDASGANTSHAFEAAGNYKVGLRVTDDDGQTAIDTLFVTVTATRVDGTTLYVGGTGGADSIAITKSGVTINGAPASFTAGGRIVVFGGGNNDTITVSPNANVSLEAYGGAGNDSIAGGGGNDILVGGEGNDVLYAAQAATCSSEARARTASSANRKTTSSLPPSPLTTTTPATSTRS
jgi:hypothetical protein